MPPGAGTATEGQRPGVHLMPGRSAWVEIDTGALRSNVEELDRRAGSAELMAVVKADGYGHGAVAASRAALAGGATWLGVAQLDEAMTLRAAGIDGSLLAWLYPPDADFAAAIQRDITLGVSSQLALDAVNRAALSTGRVVRVHLKVDTGLGRNGAAGRDWTDLVRAATRARATGALEVTGVWTHLVRADQPEHPINQLQRDRFEHAVRDLDRAGLPGVVRHVANSAATLTNPAVHYDMVRTGIASYGLSPAPGLGAPSTWALREAMRLVGVLAGVKRVRAGHGVGYGPEYVTDRATVLGLVPLGYGDGIPRAASNTGPVRVGESRSVVAGSVCMDQFVVDLGPSFAGGPGDPVIVFGREMDDEPTAQDWATAAGTISYEIVTRVGARLPRVCVGPQ